MKLNFANFVYSTLADESLQIFSKWFTYTHEIHEHTTTTVAGIIQEYYFDVGQVELTWTLHTQGSNLVNYGAKLIKVYRPILWNSIPDKIQKSPSVNIFKYHLIIEQYNNVN